jgi:dienelactone hydrolase
MFSKPICNPASDSLAQQPRVEPQSRIAIRRRATAALLLVLCLAIDRSAHAATARRISVRTEDGLNVAGTYFESSRRPSPGIVLLHMLGRTHDDWLTAGSRLADAGYAVLAIDFRNGGDASQEALELDIKAAKAFLRERPDVVPNAIGIAGASIGANMAVIDGADDPNVQSIVLLSPGLDYRNLRTEAPMRKFGARSALLVSSTKDPYAWRSVRALAAIGPGTREVRLTDILAHGTVLLSKDPDLAGALVDWFRRTLL